MTISKIPDGYKQTEIGVIPEDWEVKRLQETVKKFLNGGTPSTQKVEYWCGHIPWITGADIVKQQVSDIRRFITLGAIKNSSTNIVEKGNLLLVSRTGVGKLAIAPFDIAISQDFTGIYLKNEILLTKYIYYYLDFNSCELQSQNQGTSIQGITRDRLSIMLIPIPPIPEQSAIAAALSDTDSLITSLEQLIAKKRAIKQGAMEELLTGKRRLPGFCGEWEVKKLGEVSFVTKLAGFEYTMYFDYSKSGDVVAIRALNIKNGKLKLNDIHTIPKETSNLLKRSKLFKGDLVLSYVGTLGQVAVIPEDDKYHLAPNVAKVSVNRNKVDSFYLNQFLNSERGQCEILKLAASTTQAALSMQNLREVLILLPNTKAEQTAIAQILSDMDTEIEALEQKLEKYKKIKQGMMEELLTGRTRLI